MKVSKKKLKRNLLTKKKVRSISIRKKDFTKKKKFKKQKKTKRKRKRTISGGSPTKEKKKKLSKEQESKEEYLKYLKRNKERKKKLEQERKQRKERKERERKKREREKKKPPNWTRNPLYGHIIQTQPQPQSHAQTHVNDAFTGFGENVYDPYSEITEGEIKIDGSVEINEELGGFGPEAGSGTGVASGSVVYAASDTPDTAPATASLYSQVIKPIKINGSVEINEPFTIYTELAFPKLETNQKLIYIGPNKTHKLKDGEYLNTGDIVEFIREVNPNTINVKKNKYLFNNIPRDQFSIETLKKIKLKYIGLNKKYRSTDGKYLNKGDFVEFISEEKGNKINVKKDENVFNNIPRDQFSKEEETTYADINSPIYADINSPIHVKGTVKIQTEEEEEVEI